MSSAAAPLRWRPSRASPDHDELEVVVHDVVVPVFDDAVRALGTAQPQRSDQRAGLHGEDVAVERAHHAIALEPPLGEARAGMVARVLDRIGLTVDQRDEDIERIVLEAKKLPALEVGLGDSRDELQGRAPNGRRISWPSRCQRWADPRARGVARRAHARRGARGCADRGPRGSPDAPRRR